MSTEDTLPVPGIHLPEVPEVPAAPVVTAAPTIADISKYEAEKEARQLKTWVIKLIVGVVALMFAFICAAFIYASVVKPTGENTDPSVIKAFLDTLLEMFKVMKN